MCLHVPAERDLGQVDVRRLVHEHAILAGYRLGGATGGQAGVSRPGDGGRTRRRAAPLFHATAFCIGWFVITVDSGPEPGIMASNPLEPLCSPRMAGLGSYRRCPLRESPSRVVMHRAARPRPASPAGHHQAPFDKPPIGSIVTLSGRPPGRPTRFRPCWLAWDVSPV